ncbi:MAG: Universal stress protein UspA [Polaromonas sp.]|nr:Universal stress protein UspA [Polaromonas sp.]
MLVVATAEPFAVPERFVLERIVLAYDGSATTRRAVQMVASSALLKGLPVLLAMAAETAFSAERDALIAQQQGAHVNEQIGLSWALRAWQ